MSEHHRHVRQIVPLDECYIDDYGTLQPQRFEYCALCKCVPETLVAKNPEEVRDAEQ